MSKIDKIAKAAFERFAANFDLDSDPWQDMPLSEVFERGFKAAFEEGSYDAFDEELLNEESSLSWSDDFLSVSEVLEALKEDLK